MEDEDRNQESPDATGRYRLPPPGGWGSVGQPGYRRPDETPTGGAEPGAPAARGSGNRWAPVGGPGGRGGAQQLPPGQALGGWSASPGGWGPPGGGFGGVAGGSASSSRAKPNTGRKVLVGLGVLVAAAGLGSGLTLALGGTGNSGTSQPSGSNGTGPATVSAGSLNVSAISSAVDPGVVDITSVLGYQNDEDAGTGMVLTSSGEVVTNNHVIDGATSITVNVAGQSRTYKAKVLGTDPNRDIALIKMEGASGLKTVTLGNSSTVKVGAGVVAIGNALDLPGPPTVTSGTITAEGRSITAEDESSADSEKLTGMFQTNAELQPGNSGGPLATSNDKVVAMDTAAATDTEEDTTNVGFAIPINTVESVVRQIQSGKGTSEVQIGNGTRGYLGVAVVSVSALESGAGTAGNAGLGGGYGGLGGYGGYGGYTPPTSSGAYVEDVDPGSPAAKAGLQEGDVITSANGTKVTTSKGLTKIFDLTKPGDKITVGWFDATGQSVSATVTLITGPAD